MKWKIWSLTWQTALLLMNSYQWVNSALHEQWAAAAFFSVWSIFWLYEIRLIKWDDKLSDGLVYVGLKAESR